MNDNQKRRLENQLIVMGLNKLNDPLLVPQMARLIPDHNTFLGMLNSCDKEKRTEMYEALRPHLKFQAWPLESYLIRLKEHASNLDSKFKPIKVGDQKFQETSRDTATGCIITLTCCKCTRFEEFYAPTPVQAMCMAREKGWVRDLVREKEICPKCPAIRKKVGHA
jgi:hypothetical protein